jgi:hypothetical protein
MHAMAPILLREEWPTARALLCERIAAEACAIPDAG